MMIKMKGTPRYYSGWYMQSVEAATPHTRWRYTRNRQDAFEGFAMIDKIFTTRVKRRLPGLDNFLMAGQSDSTQPAQYRAFRSGTN